MCINNGRTISTIINGVRKIVKVYKGLVEIYKEKMKTLEEETNIILNDILSVDEDTETVIDMSEEEINESLDYIIGG